MSLRNVDSNRSFHALNALFESLASAVVPNSCDVVVVAGRLDHQRLRAAIGQALQAHPILCSRMVRQGQGTAWQVPDAELALDIRFHILDHDEPDTVDAHLLGLVWDEPLPQDRRPVRFHVTETPARTYVQTIHTHIYADATACYTLTEHIAAIYGGQPGELERMDVAQRGITELFAKTLSRGEQLTLRARGIAQTLRDLGTKHGGLALPRRSTAGRRRLARFVFSPEETRQMRAAARERGHSIHAFFQLAFLRAATEYNRQRNVERPRLRLWDFFSLRPLADEARTLYDCLALIYPVELDARWSDDQVLAHCTQTIEEMRKRDLLMHAYRFQSLFQVFGKLVPARWFMKIWPYLFKSNVFLTNPGVCPSRLERFGDAPVIEYVTFPQLFFPADLMFVFSTFRDCLRILVLYDEDALGSTIHQELLQPFLHNLGALAGLDLAAASTRDGFVAGSAAHRDPLPAEQTPMRHSA